MWEVWMEISVKKVWYYSQIERISWQEINHNNDNLRKESILLSTYEWELIPIYNMKHMELILVIPWPIPVSLNHPKLLLPSTEWIPHL